MQPIGHLIMGCILSHVPLGGRSVSHDASDNSSNQNSNINNNNDNAGQLLDTGQQTRGLVQLCNSVKGEECQQNGQTSIHTDVDTTSASILISFDEINQTGGQKIDLGQLEGRGVTPTTTTTIVHNKTARACDFGEMSREQRSLKRKRVADMGSLSVSMLNQQHRNARAQDKRSNSNKGNLLASIISLLVNRKRHSSARIEVAEGEENLAPASEGQPVVKQQQHNELLFKKSKLELQDDGQTSSASGGGMVSNQFESSGSLEVQSRSDEIHKKMEGSNPQVKRLQMPNTTPDTTSTTTTQQYDSSLLDLATKRAINSPCPTLQQVENQNEIEQEAILLFTSVQQLCYEMIDQNLVRRQAEQPSIAQAAASVRSVSSVDQHHHAHHYQHNQQQQQTLCLFLFGRQGSCMGELSFELVQHSSLIGFIHDMQANQNTQQTSSSSTPAASRLTALGPSAADEPTSIGHECPLYHYIDVAALIVANIDRRIREYNQLVARTLRARRQLMSDDDDEEEEGDGCQDKEVRQRGSDSQEDSVVKQGLSGAAASRPRRDDADSVGSNSGTGGSQDGDANRSRDGIELGANGAGGVSGDSVSLWSKDPLREPSIASDLSMRAQSPMDRMRPSSAEGGVQACEHHQLTNHDQFGMVTLSTRQRSILQLKLIKYATCVTTKWITLLIHNEINRLEAQLKRLDTQARKGSPRPAESQTQPPPPPPRVYLINLVPNQLSLFKTCLYLQQELPLSSFRHRYWAVKFERRTNIRLMTKEHGAGGGGGQATADANQLGPDSGPQSSSSSSHRRSSTGAGTSTESAPQRLFHRLRLPPIRLPAILVPRSSSEPNLMSTGELKSTGQRPADSDSSRPDEQQQKQRRGQLIEVTASNLLANSVNEKLGPKFNENFSNQFKLLNKLTLMRYNPIKNYNYATTDPVGEVFATEVFGGQQASGRWWLSENNYDLSTRYDRRLARSSRSCYSQLTTIRHHHRHHHHRASPPASPNYSIASGDSSNQHHQQQFVFFPANLHTMPTTDPVTTTTTSTIGQQHLRLPDQHDRHHQSPSAGSVISSNGSSYEPSGSSSLLHAYATNTGMHFSRPSQSASCISPSPSSLGPSTGHALKWAIELELIDASDNDNKWYSKSSSGHSGVAGYVGGSSTMAIDLEAEDSLAANQDRDAMSQPQSPSAPTTATVANNCCLHVYRPPAARCSSSRSPLSLVSTGNRVSSGGGTSTSVSGHFGVGSSVQATNCLTGHYYLVSTRVAYANGMSQSILEAKTIHRRPIRYTSHSDSQKLVKTIQKAHEQLSADLNAWLRAALDTSGGGGGSSSSSSPDLVSNHVHIQQQQNHHQHHHQQRHHHQQLQRITTGATPLLAVYTIRVDVAKMLARLGKADCLGDGDHHQLHSPTTAGHQSLGHSLAAGAGATGVERRGDHRSCQLSPNDLAHLLQMRPERPTLSKRPASALAGDFGGGSGGRTSHTSGSRALSSRLSLPPTTASGQPNGRAESSLGADLGPARSAETVAGGGGAPTISKPRHVQFNLSRAPQIEGRHEMLNSDASGDSLQIRAQKRVWLQESLFVSCSDAKLSPVIDLFVNDMLKSLARN